jgi:hypothetical protein
MTLEAYIPSEATFAGATIADPVLVTLHDLDGESPHGSMTTRNALPTGERGGPLVFVGTREGKTWRVTLAEIEVRNRSALGFEYGIVGPVRREALAEQAEGEKKDQPETSLQDLGATF